MLVDDRGRVLLSRRRDRNPVFDGLWHLPSGKLDAGESVLDAATREAEEEIGVRIDPADLRHVHTMHVNGSGPEPRLGLFFETHRRTLQHPRLDARCHPAHAPTTPGRPPSCR